MSKHQALNRMALTDRSVVAIVPRRKSFNDRYVVWDESLQGFGVEVHANGTKSWKYVYSLKGRPRWVTLGRVGVIDATEARKRALRLAVARYDGRDPAAERQAERKADTFGVLLSRYIVERASRHNRSWRQCEALLRKHALPRWEHRIAKSIALRDVYELLGSIRSPSVANQVMVNLGALFKWAVRVQVVAVNPVRGIERNPTQARERILSDAELPAFWNAFTVRGLAVFKVLLLTGQRPGEIAHMRREHIVGNWWNLPGLPVAELGWPGVKNSKSHRVYLVPEVLALIGSDTSGYVFRRRTGLDSLMREICREMNVPSRATPHDLRRTCASMITRLRFGRDAMDRILNHRKKSTSATYDRYAYEVEDRHIMEAVAAKIMALVEGREAASNVVALR